MCDALIRCNSSIQLLWLGDNRFDDNCMVFIGKYLQQNPNIKEVFLGENEITDKGIEIISEYLTGNVTLRELSFRFNREVTDKSMPFFVKISKESCIKKLDLEYTLLSEANQDTIYNLLMIPSDEREIPINSNSKSAAKN